MIELFTNFYEIAGFVGNAVVIGAFSALTLIMILRLFYDDDDGDDV